MVVALAEGTVIDFDKILVSSLIFITLNHSGLPYSTAIWHPQELIVVGPLLEQDVTPIGAAGVVISHQALLGRDSQSELTLHKYVTAIKLAASVESEMSDDIVAFYI